MIYYCSCTRTVSEGFSSALPLIKIVSEYKYSGTLSQMELYRGEEEGRQGRKSEQLTSAKHYIPLRFFDLTGKNQRIMLLTIDLTLFLRVIC